MSWSVFIINMAKNTTRMDHAAAQLEQLDIAFERFEAVDGRALSAEALTRAYDPAANLKRARHAMVGPEIGCYLSHLALWEKIAAGDAAGGIILEDDFTCDADFGTVLEAVAQHRGDWDILKLFSARKGQKLLDPRPLTAQRQIAVPYKVPNTTLGYAIRRETAARLAAQTLPVSRPIDEDHKHFWEAGLRIALVSPSPLAFGEQSAETGTITAARRRKVSGPPSAVLRQAWRSLRFRVSYLLHLHWHRFMRHLR
jgi:glycosyl transferase, family 25